MASLEGVSVNYRHLCPRRVRTQVRTGPVWIISVDEADDADEVDDADEFREAIFCWQAAWFSDIYSESDVQKGCVSRKKTQGQCQGQSTKL